MKPRIRDLAAGLIALLNAVVPAASQQVPPRPAIAVTGTGEVELKPDFARLLLSIDTVADSVALATASNRTASERVLARMETLGVKRSDIQTANLQVYRVPRGDGPSDRAMRFAVSHQLRITAREIEAVGRLTGDILAIEGVGFRSVTWGMDRSDSGRDEARRAAVKDAQRQAQVYAEAAGVKLGPLVEIRDGAVQAFGAEEAAAPMRMSASQDTSFPVVPPASVRYSASVQMVWEIVP